MNPEATSVYAHLEKPSMVDFPGRMAAVMFTSGCNFDCGFCHNAELMGRNHDGLSRNQLERACAQFKQNWVNAVVLTGGEPTCCHDVVDLIRFFKEYFGFAVKLDTNGSNPDKLANCLPLVDYVAMDIKTGLSAYPGLTGFSDTDKIRQSIELIKTEALDYEFRTTVIDGVHTDELMGEIATTLSGSRRYALQTFVPRANLPGEQFRNTPRTTAARLHELKDRLEGCAEEILLRGA
jgi:pyruvate formate lyase activating enzyme